MFLKLIVFEVINIYRFSKSIYPVEITRNYAKFEGLEVVNDYTFRIWSGDAFGRSENWSTVFVPKAPDRMFVINLFTFVLLKSCTLQG